MLPDFVLSGTRGDCYHSQARVVQEYENEERWSLPFLRLRFASTHATCMHCAVLSLFGTVYPAGRL